MRIWTEFLDASKLTADEIRPGCEPRCFEHAGEAERALVLIHGLTDSPHFMDALARRFHARGWNVYLPLLHMHGLLEPRSMEGVSLEEWKRNVGFALDVARREGARVSAGGLSTGGSLALWEALRPDSKVDGAVLLFAGAVRLVAQKPSRLAKLAHRAGLDALRRMLGRPSRFEGELIGENPYRYDRMDLAGVRQLLRLLKEIDALLKEHGDQPIEVPVFAAHSEIDAAADFKAVRAFVERVHPHHAEFHALPASLGVPHASVVLEQDVFSASGSLLEGRNPAFDDMADRAVAFGERHG